MSKSNSSSKRIHNVFKEAIKMLQEKGVVFQKPSSSKDLYYVRNWAVVANKFSGMTFIISKNIAEIVEMFQKEKLDIQVLSVYSKVFSAAYFTVGCTSVSPTELFKVLSVFTGLPNCFTQLSSLNPGAWDSSHYQSGFKLAVMLSQSPSTGSNLVVSCSSLNS